MVNDGDSELETSKQGHNAASEQERSAAMPRRQFLAQGITAAGSLVAGAGVGSEVLAQGQSGSTINVRSLQSEFKFKGQVLQPSDADFNKVALGGLWNELRPKRAPQLVLRV